MNWWSIYPLGVMLSGGLFSFSVYRTLADGVAKIQVESEDGPLPWQVLAGTGVATLGAAVIWPISIPLFLLVGYFACRNK